MIFLFIGAVNFSHLWPMQGGPPLLAKEIFKQRRPFNNISDVHQSRSYRRDRWKGHKVSEISTKSWSVGASLSGGGRGSNTAQNLKFVEGGSGFCGHTRHRSLVRFAARAVEDSMRKVSKMVVTKGEPSGVVELETCQNMGK